MSREAIEEAIEVLEDASAEMLMETGDKNYYVEAIAVLRQALETEQEPVAWLDPEENISDEAFTWSQSKHHTVPLYTAPPKAAEWVGLTDEDLEVLFLNEDGVRFARYIEAKLKEKNT